MLRPDVSATYAVYSSHSKLDGTMAKLGVQIANTIPGVESYWQGAVALVPPEGASTDWGTAIVWLREGRVARVVVNLLADDKLSDMPGVLAGIYGAAGSTQGTVTTWALPSGVTAKLDIGAAVALVVQDGGAGAPAGSVAPAATAR